MSFDITTAEAFNAGSDARIRGEPKIVPEGFFDIGAKYWVFGWDDVDLNWGRGARGPHMMLPKVREVA